MKRVVHITIDVHDDSWFECSAHFGDAPPAHRQYAADMARFLLSRMGFDSRVETLSQMPGSPRSAPFRSDGAATWREGE